MLVEKCSHKKVLFAIRFNRQGIIGWPLHASHRTSSVPASVLFTALQSLVLRQLLPVFLSS